MIIEYNLFFCQMDFEHVLDDLYTKLNQCRLHPRETAGYLTQLRSAYQGKLFKNKIKTRQGPGALDNLIQDLVQRSPIGNRLKWSFALHMAADELAETLGEKGLFTTEGTSFHRTLPDRVRDYAIVKGRLSQVYEFGGRTPQQILQELLIDDGLTSRKRRNTLLDPIFKYIGIGCSYHQSNEACTVIILAEDIISLVAPDSNGRYRKRMGFQTGKENVIKLVDQFMINNNMGQLVYNPITHTNEPSQPSHLNQSNANLNQNLNNANSSLNANNPSLNNSIANSIASLTNTNANPQMPSTPAFNKQPQFILSESPAGYDARQTPIQNLNTSRQTSNMNTSQYQVPQQMHMSTSQQSQVPSQMQQSHQSINPLATYNNNTDLRQSQNNSVLNQSFGQTSVVNKNAGETVQYVTPGDSRISGVSNAQSINPLQPNASLNTTLNPNLNNNMNQSNTNPNLYQSNVNQNNNTNLSQPPILQQNRQGSVVTYEPHNSNYIPPDQLNSQSFNKNSYVVPKTITNNSIAQSQLKRAQQQQYNLYKLPENNANNLATSTYHGPGAINIGTVDTTQKKESKCAIM